MVNGDYCQPLNLLFDLGEWNLSLGLRYQSGVLMLNRPSYDAGFQARQWSDIS